MPDLRLERLTTAANAFEARVIAARLGAEGILWQLRGSVDGPLAVGPVEVLVTADDFDVARELLLADAVEDALADHGGEEPSSGPGGYGLVWLAAAFSGMTLFTIARIAALV
ncbi:MAG: putative signal transducing protein [Acidimicrobiales bacterium]